MKRKLKLLVTLVLGITLMVGFNSCGKESSGGIEPTPVNPTPNNGGGGNDKPTPENPDVQQLYEDAFKIISESHDYKKAVENLTQAAEANVDSANLTLAYMYEYGIGVNQDIEKAKDLYAREASAHNNEFAADKLASLSSTHNNCVVQLPEGCNIRTNEVLIDCGDTITVANGDGSFNTSAILVKTRDFDGEYVNICYRHPDTKGKTELNSMETAVTLMLCNVPYGFNLSESAYKKVREQLLQLEETKQLAEEIDKQVKANGHFDIETVAPFVSKGCKTIYRLYGTGSSLSKSAPMGLYAGVVDRFGFHIYDDYDNYCFLGDGREKNDITTTFKSGYYDPQNKEWNTVVNIRNLSQTCIMAVPGNIDVETKEFVAKYDNIIERLGNGTFVTSSNFFDFGGGSVSGFIESNMNFFRMLWLCANQNAYYTSVDEISLVNDIKTSLELWGDAQRAYRETYLAVDEEVELTIRTSYDAMQYLYPYNAPEVAAFFLTYYCVLPCVEFATVLPNGSDKDSDKKKKNAFLEISIDVLKELFQDKDFLPSVQQCISSGKWRDDNAIKLYQKIVWAIVQGCNNYLDKLGYLDKNATKWVKTQFDVYDKVSDEKYENAMFKEAKFYEKILLKDNEVVKQFTKVLSTAEDLITFFDGVIGMLSGDYRSFVVRFSISNEDLHLMYRSIENVVTGSQAIFTVKSSTLNTANMAIYANDYLLVKDEDALSLSYDLSKLPPGSYNIKIVADFMLDDGAMCNFVTKTGEFRCNVTPPFNGKVSPATGVDINIDTRGNGFVPNVQGQYLDQNYNGGATTSDVKGHNL